MAFDESVMESGGQLAPPVVFKETAADDGLAKHSFDGFLSWAKRSLTLPFADLGSALWFFYLPSVMQLFLPYAFYYQASKADWIYHDQGTRNVDHLGDTLVQLALSLRVDTTFWLFFGLLLGRAISRTGALLGQRNYFYSYVASAPKPPLASSVALLARPLSVGIAADITFVGLSVLLVWTNSDRILNSVSPSQMLLVFAVVALILIASWFASLAFGSFVFPANIASEALPMTKRFATPWRFSEDVRAKAFARQLALKTATVPFVIICLYLVSATFGTLANSGTDYEQRWAEATVLGDVLPAAYWPLAMAAIFGLSTGLAKSLQASSTVTIFVDALASKTRSA